MLSQTLCDSISYNGFVVVYAAVMWIALVLEKLTVRQQHLETIRNKRKKAGQTCSCVSNLSGHVVLVDDQIL